MKKSGPASNGSSERMNPWLAVAIIALGALAIYFRSFSVPLLFDDFFSITDNPTIKHLWPLAPIFAPPEYAGVGGRPLLNLSYAINYAFGGESVFGYHLVNFGIHIAAACVLFALVRLTLRLPELNPRFGPAATRIALVATAIWAWHPVQTVSVTYLSQRAEELMGMLYLLTLYGFARHATAQGGPKVAGCGALSGTAWGVLSVLSCLAAVFVKEVIVTAPLAVLFYDRTFLAGDFATALRKRWRLYAALFATWIPLIILLRGLGHRGAGLGMGIGVWPYALTESVVVVKYLFLAIWPNPLVFDYGLDITATLGAAWPYALAIAGMLAAVAWALYRRSPMGFASLWFFLILAPTSTVVPIFGQAMAENRLYLPLAGVSIIAVAGGYALLGRRALAALGSIALVLAWVAADRNRAYTSEETIWRDTVAKRPGNPRAHNNLANALLNSADPKKIPEAIAQLETALRIKPDYPEASNNLANAWSMTPGHTEDAIRNYREALRARPHFAEAHNNLGSELIKLPDGLDGAIAEFEEAVREKPDYSNAHNNLGSALLKKPDRLPDAIAHFREAIRLDPRFAAPHNNLGNCLAKVPGRTGEAILEYREAIRLKPDFAVAHINLGLALFSQPGHEAEAIAEYREALRYEPGSAAAHKNLGNVLATLPGRESEAGTHYEEALRLEADDAEALNNLGIILDALGRREEARERYRRAIAVDPANAKTHYNLGVSLDASGRLDEAKAEYEKSIQLNPNASKVHNNLGNVLLALGRNEAALVQYNEALRLQPGFPAALINRALVLRSMPGRANEAAADLETVIRMQPDNARARAMLDELRGRAH